MTNQFQAIYERDGECYIAYYPEIPDANGIGKTQEECRENLIDAIKLILQVRYEDSINSINDYVKNITTII
ncbi:MAG: hypothetical protein QG635_984 [Bacteroidota bacterium]|nr:hypothetical protein [Bacteroidota bacterium]